MQASATHLARQVLLVGKGKQRNMLTAMGDSGDGANVHKVTMNGRSSSHRW